MMDAILGLLGLWAACPHPAYRTPQPPTVYETDAEPRLRNAIDAAVFSHLERCRIRPARPCSDAVFLRRVWLDVAGRLPDMETARAFLADRRPDKRERLVDRLVASEEFADVMAMRFADVLRIRSEFPINLWPNAAQAYHRWIRDALRDGMRFDAFARRLLTASGSNFRVPEVNFWRAVPDREPETLARIVALTFLGVRADRWPRERLAGLAGFFARVGYKATREWKEEIVFFDPGRPPRPAVYPDGVAARLAPDEDPRVAFAQWLTEPRNPWFARAAVNRVWFWFLGRGVVHEPDDLRPDNPPTVPGLLEVLAAKFVESGYDLRELVRTILVSQTYQLSCVPRSDDSRAEASFAYHPLRRLPAEILIDVLDRITGTSERYTSLIPEPWTFVPPGWGAVRLWDASITSPFLEMFGRPARATGLLSERNDSLSAAQRLHLLNSSHVQRKIEQGPRLRMLLRRARGEELIDALYLTILSRHPTAAERRIASRHLAGTRGAEAAVDLAWALLNSMEFLYRH